MATQKSACGFSVAHYPRDFVPPARVFLASEGCSVRRLDATGAYGTILRRKSLQMPVELPEFWQIGGRRDNPRIIKLSFKKFIAV